MLGFIAWELDIVLMVSYVPTCMVTGTMLFVWDLTLMAVMLIHGYVLGTMTG